MSYRVELPHDGPFLLAVSSSSGDGSLYIDMRTVPAIEIVGERARIYFNGGFQLVDLTDDVDLLAYWKAWRDDVSLGSEPS